MHRDEYKAIKDHPLRDLLNSAASKYPPSRTQVEYAIDAAGIGDPKFRKAIYDDVVSLAKRAADGESPFELRQRADQMTVPHVKALHAADDLLGREPDWRSDDDTTGDDLADRVQLKGRGMDDQQIEQELADRAERDRLAKLGVKVDG